MCFFFCRSISNANLLRRSNLGKKVESFIIKSNQISCSFYKGQCAVAISILKRLCFLFRNGFEKNLVVVGLDLNEPFHAAKLAFTL
jgi:hypothetical protein